MNPALSVVLLTTLIGAGQGLLLALVAADWAGEGINNAALTRLLVLGGMIALALTAAGLAASFFHLGRPGRAWRAAAQWRSSWLSREVIALPLFMAACLAWTLAQHLGAHGRVTAGLGVLAALACAALFVCTGMVYASVRFLQEWASPLTLLNFSLLGLASGCTLAAALASALSPPQVPAFGSAAVLFTGLGLATRALSLWRNARLRPRSTLQSALGIRHPVIRQRAMGFMGGSFNTREFFHGRSLGALRQLKWAFVLGGFVLPMALLVAGVTAGSGELSSLLLGAAFGVQYLGLLAERWFFLAQANHPQNLYYQAVS